MCAHVLTPTHVYWSICNCVIENRLGPQNIQIRKHLQGNGADNVYLQTTESTCTCKLTYPHILSTPTHKSWAANAMSRESHVIPQILYRAS